MWSAQTIQLIHAACDEDLGRVGDLTGAVLPTGDAAIPARVVPRADGVISGLALGSQICSVFAERLDTPLAFEPLTRAGAPLADGSKVKSGQAVARVRGSRTAVLAVERTLLNFLGRLSGVATLTQRYVQTARLANPHVQVLDTRKTVPGWRELDKYAVRCGGGHNHRMGLYDAVLIKDNHLAGVSTARLASTLAEMLRRITGHARTPGLEPRAPAKGRVPKRPPRLRAGRGLRKTPAFVEVEVDDLPQLRAVCKVAGVDVVLLDNFPCADLRRAVAYRDQQGLRGTLALEASGRITLENIADVAATGVDRISVGALTHSAPSLDVGLDF